MMKRRPAAVCCRELTNGISLVIVLGSLVFLSALVVAFLVQMSTELKSSKLYAEGASARMLAQSASNIVLNQIKDATKGDNNGRPLAWASQPGMIRTYDDLGVPHQYFKLYSDNTMVGDVGDQFNATANASDLANWPANKALYTDLNQPVTVGAEKVYPIVDGNLVDMTLPAAGKVQTYNADSDSANPDIDGFYVKGAPVATGATPSPVPMPVKWLYVLANGEVVAPIDKSGNTVQVPGADAKNNPIVGRVAFWTDDESCKVNINTASEGVYWDTPRVKSEQEDVFKVNQPVNHEYQRYPGHPAMTSLSTVIKHPATWSPGIPIPTFAAGKDKKAVKFTLCTPAQWIDYQWAQKLYNIIPRIGTGGSNAGSVKSAMLNPNTTPPETPPAVTLDADRLYASVDELTFKPDRTSNNSELADLGVLSKATLERDKFFLTASSRAPDVNLFNKPRVSIWPLHANDDPAAGYRTPFDSLIAFCTTMRNDLGSGAYRYYFQRQDPNRPVTDLPTNGSLAGLGRNRMLLEYLRSLTTQAIPGFGGNFGAKYGADNDQILTEIFDYVRSTNLRDVLLVNNGDESKSTSYTKGIPGSPWSNGMGQVVPIVDTTTNTRGFGRFQTVQGASVLFIGQVDGDDPLVSRHPTTHASVPPFPASTSQVDPVSGKPLPTYNDGTIVTDAVAPGKMRIQAMFIPQFFSPSVGATWIRNNFQWSVDLSQLRLNGAPMGFPAVESKYTQNQRPKDETGFGDQLGLRQASQAASLLSQPMDIPKGTFSFGGKVTMKIWAADAVAGPPQSTTLLQTIVLDFNGPDCAVPELAYGHVANKNDSGNFDDTSTPLYFLNYRSFTDVTGAYNSASPDNPLPKNKKNLKSADVNVNAVEGGRLRGLLDTRGAQGFIIPPDAIRSVRVTSGDTRLVAAQTDPPESLFEANPAEDKLMGAHNFFTGYGQPYYGAALGKLVPNLAYSGPINTANRQLSTNAVSQVFGFQGFSPASDIPLNGVEAGSRASFSSGIPGDWDNAPFAIRDGPFINKADEGDVGSVDSGGILIEPYSWKIKAQSKGNMNAALFTPNRMIPSAVTFGSLPTGVKANRPWQTLLFRPEPGHPGSGSPIRSIPGPPYSTPPDHLLLDLFTMPVVEPYAISEPLSTAGRINMNYQIVPFTYINRDTGIRALLKAEKVISINDSQVGKYKQLQYTNPTQYDIRFDVNPEETLKGFQARFNSNDIFRSAGEICDLHIVPKDDPTGSYPGSTLDTYATMPAYWSTHRLTGDNSKERIYATLYPRLTTKSNTFTVHVRAQSLKKVKQIGSSDLWVEGIDQVTGEYRGSQTVERFIDPNHAGNPDDPKDPSLPDYAQTTGFLPLISEFYKFRVVSTKQFAP